MNTTMPRPVRPGLVLAICCTSLLMVSMDITIVNVALPAIRHDLGAKTSGLQWVIDAYTVVVASLLMLSARSRIGSAAGGRSRRGWWCSRSRRRCAASRRTCTR
jgi:MFS family permease